MSDNNRYAVIDLGTNTFHLLAIELLPDEEVRRLHKQRIYVKLAEDGIGKIGEGAFKRGVDALTTFKGILDEFAITDVRAFGTAALRTASNGNDFARKIKDELGLEIDIISGKEEARLVHQGVIQAIMPQEERFVIIDIGGGSVEFIIADNDKVYWSESFPIGVAVLFKEFHHSNPIDEKELKKLTNFLEKELNPFFEAVKKYNGKILVGASGTFDVLEIMMEQRKKTEKSTELYIETFFPLYSKLIHTTLEERCGNDDIPDTRADMIVVALELIRFVIEKAQITDIVVSAYAMKEGILKEMMVENKTDIE
ncbi:MAG: exopolyphosphatase/guanosine-5'-triphosphate,3'-diphosphate pyrophosphatase [Maribacter sp.]|jgi:exopolyphosphatase/guanosine-5'-triphosphate,3'-diphosphate pyrophosphatase